MGLLDLFRRKRQPPVDSRMELRKRFYDSAMAVLWNWRGGFASWGGQKYPGALGYPSGWNLNHWQLRKRSRIAYWDSAEARALIGRLCQNTVNIGLSMEATPIWELVAPKMTEEKRREWVQNVEARWRLWANSTEADATGRMTFQQLQGFAFFNTLGEGEVFSVLRYSSDRRRMNPLSIQFVDVDQITGSAKQEDYEAAKERGNRIVDGIEVDSAGAEIAYYVTDPETGKTTRIPRYGGKSKRLFVAHPAIIERIGQVRGIPVLANMVHELQKITDYTVAELEAAVINAVFAVWIKPSDSKSSSRALAGALKREQVPAVEDPYDRVVPPAPAHIDKPGLLIQNLKAGEEIESFDTKRPNVNFENFSKAVLTKLSASLGIPIEVLFMSFNQNYSASRACLILAWNVFAQWRYFLASSFLNPIKAEWMAAEIAAENISAPGFNDSPVLRAAWLNCDWIGINKPSIDPSKEADAADKRIAAGLLTRERAAQDYNGSEYTQNVERLKIENKELAEANKPLGKKESKPAFGNNGSSESEEEALVGGNGKEREE